MMTFVVIILVILGLFNPLWIGILWAIGIGILVAQTICAFRDRRFDPIEWHFTLIKNAIILGVLLWLGLR